MNGRTDEFIASKRGSAAANTAFGLVRKALDAASGKPRLMINNGAGALMNVTGHSTMDGGTWYYVVGQFDPGNEIVIHQGPGRRVKDSVPASLVDSALDFHIGARDSATGPTDYFTGKAALVFLCQGLVPSDSLWLLWQISRGLFGRRS